MPLTQQSKSSPRSVSPTFVPLKVHDTQGFEVEPAQSLPSPVVTYPAAQSMSTAALVARLVDVAGAKPNCDSFALFKRIESYCLNAAVQLKPMPLNSSGSPASNIQIKARTLINLFGQRFTIKGSAVPRFMVPRQQKVNLNGLNDFDVAVPIKNVNPTKIRQKLAQYLRENKIDKNDKIDKSTAKQLHSQSLAMTSNKNSLVKTNSIEDLTDDELLQVYLRSWLTGDGFVKVRFNVAPGSMPLDLVLYQELAADFDSLHASASIDVVLDQKIATQSQVLTEKVQDFLEQHQLLWLNETMTGGLKRIQKLMTKWPQGALLQPQPIVERLYQQDCPANQSAFVIWLMGRMQPDDSKLSYFEPIFKAVHQLHIETQDAALTILLNNLLSEFSPGELTESYSKKIVQCVRVFPECAKSLQHYLEKNPSLLKNACLNIDALLPNPTCEKLISLWRLPETEHNPQLRLLLGPISTVLVNDADTTSVDPQARAVLNVHQSRFGEFTSELQASQQWLSLESASTASNSKITTGLTRASVLKRLGHKLALMLAKQDLGFMTSARNQLKAFDGFIPLLSSKDLKHFKGLVFPYTQFTKLEKLQFRDQFPRIELMLFFLHLRQQVQEGGFKWSAHSNNFDLRARCVELHNKSAQIKALLTSDYVERKGEFENKTGLWFDVGGTLCVVTPTELYIGSASVNAHEKPLFNGVGVLYQAQDSLVIVAQFRKGHLQDSKAHVLAQTGEFCLSLDGQAVKGKGLWQPAEPSLDLLKMQQELERFLLPANPLEQIKVEGSWCAALTKVIQNPLELLEEGTVFFNSQKADSIILEAGRINIKRGCAVEGEIRNYRGDPELLLRLKAQALSPDVLVAGWALSHQDTLLVRTSSTNDNGIIETAFVDFDFNKGILAGPALVRRHNEQFIGGFHDTQPQGKGRLIKQGETYGRFVNMKNGEVHDPELLLLMSGQGYIKDVYLSNLFAQRIPILPYQLPPPTIPKAFFSIENEEGGKVQGLWQSKIGVGVMQLSNRPNEMLIGRFLLACETVEHFLHHSVSPKNSLTWSLPYTHGKPPKVIHERFYDHMGSPIKLLPHGPVTIRDKRTLQEHQKLFAFGQILPNVHLTKPDEELLVYQQESDPGQFFALGAHEAFYNMRIVEEKSNFNTEKITTGEDRLCGSMTIASTHYVGNLKGLLPDGNGVRTDVYGATLKGRFKLGFLLCGELQFKNGVSISGHWTNGRFQGPAVITVPFKEKKLVFHTKMREDVCLGLAFTKVNGKELTLEPGPIAKSLLSYGLSLSPQEIKHFYEA